MASEILQRITNDIKDAMRSKDKEKLLTLRTLHSDIKNEGIKLRREVEDEDVASVIAKGIKQRLDAADQFTNGGRDDLAAREQAQIILLRQYQPKQLGRAEIEELAAKVIAETGASSPKDLGAVMKLLMPLVKGTADGKLVGKIVSTKLSGNG